MWRVEVFTQMTSQSLLKLDLTRKGTGGPRRRSRSPTISAQAEGETLSDLNPTGNAEKAGKG